MAGDRDPELFREVFGRFATGVAGYADQLPRQGS